DVFDAMFSRTEFATCAEGKAIVDDDLELFKALIDYVYTGSLPSHPALKLYGLIALADKYRVATLADVTIQALLKVIDMSNVVPLLESKFVHPNVEGKCIATIAEEFKLLQLSACCYDSLPADFRALPASTCCRHHK